MLEFGKLGEQVQALGSAQAAKQEQHRMRLSRGRDSLRAWASDGPGLCQKVDQALAVTQGFWPGARPGDEKLDVGYPLPLCPEQATLLAADGSQIHPDPHGVWLYFLINVGSIVLERGSGRAPDAYALPELYFTDEALYPDGNNLIRASLIDAQRDLSELARLADLAAHIRTRPAITLTDGPLLLFAYQEATIEAPKGHERNLRRWLDLLDRLHGSDALPIGYIDRPRGNRVLALMLLGELPLEEITVEQIQQIDLRGLNDTELFDFLAPGERSAVFSPQVRVSAEYRARGHEIHFFYLNVAPPEGRIPCLTRVEVPEWVVQDRHALDAVHALLYDQCQVLGGYPYILTRAHELAAVTVEDRRNLEAMIIQALESRSLRAEISEKARAKAMVAGGSRYFR